MDFKIRRIDDRYMDVRVTVDGTSIDLGLLAEWDRSALASQLREAADELDPPPPQGA